MSSSANQSTYPQISHDTIMLDNGPTLAYVLHRPTPSRPTKLALIAHPLGRLGGSKEDHVVVTVAHALAEQGYNVCRYDARGAGDSTGSGSFS